MYLFTLSLHKLRVNTPAPQRSLPSCVPVLAALCGFGSHNNNLWSRPIGIVLVFGFCPVRKKNKMKKLKIEGNFDVLRCGGLDISVLEPLASKGSKPLQNQFNPSPFVCACAVWMVSHSPTHHIVLYALLNNSMRNMSKFFCLLFLSPLCWFVKVTFCSCFYAPTCPTNNHHSRAPRSYIPASPRLSRLSIPQMTDGGRPLPECDARDRLF